jgi:hypothetical protein
MSGGHTTAFYQDLTLCSGDDRTLRFAIVDPAGAAVDLTGVQAVRWGCARLQANGNYVLPASVTKTLASGIIVADAAGGIIEVTLAADDTADLSKGRYHHELEMTDADGAVSTLAMGTMTILEDLLT